MATDTTAAAGTAYLYKVRAIGTGGPSDFSSVDLATTIIFTDAILSGVVVKAVHVNELRAAVNAVRTAAGLSGAPYTDSTITPASTFVKQAHVTELRSALNAARSALVLSAVSYTDAVPTTIKAVHMTDLRSGTQ